MVKKSNSTKQSEMPTTEVTNPSPVVATKKRAPKASLVVEPTPVVSTPVSAETVKVVAKKPRSGGKSASDAKAVSDVSTPTTRRVVSRDTVMEDFDSLATSIDNELVRVREAGDKMVSVKFVRNLARQIRNLKNHSQKIMKKRRVPVTSGDKPHNSVFQLPVRISAELAQFFDWDPEVPKSRVEVTRALCNYIKENNLQNPNDRRLIVADARLAALLHYNPETNESLNYSRLQTYMKRLFDTTTAPMPVVVAVAPTSKSNKSKSVQKK